MERCDLLAPGDRSESPSTAAAKLVWYCTFLTGYQQGCSSHSQDASHPLQLLPPVILSGKIRSVSRLCFRLAKPSTLILCGVTLRQLGSAE